MSSCAAAALLSGAFAALAPGGAHAEICTAPVGAYSAPLASPGGTVTCSAGQINSIGLTSDNNDTVLQLSPNLQVTAGGVSLTSTGSYGFGLRNISSTSGPYTGSINAGTTTNDGVLVVSNGGGITIDLSVPVTGGASGIVAATNGAGAVSVTTSGPVTALDGAGISANSGTGAPGSLVSLNLDVLGDVLAPNGPAIVANSGGGAVITIGPGVRVKGLGQSSLTTLPTAVISITTAPGALATLNNYGRIRSTVGGAGALAIYDLGSLTLNNAGSIKGRLNLYAPLGGTAAYVFNNGIGGVHSGKWETAGYDYLGGAVINNGASSPTAGAAFGKIVTAPWGVQTTLDFGSLGGTINNTPLGVFIAGKGDYSGVAITRILGPVTFINDGTIALGGRFNATAGATSDGRIDSVIEAPNTTLGGAGVIALDADLGAVTQSAGQCGSGTLSAADCLVIGGTGSSINQSLRVSDTFTHLLGAYNPGIVVVAGVPSPSAFHFDPGSSWFTLGGGNEFGGATNILNKPGLFFYDLAWDGHNAVLIGVPKVQAVDLGSLGRAATNLWFATTETVTVNNFNWNLNPIPSFLTGLAGGGPRGVWVTAAGDVAHQGGEQSITILNRTYNFDTSFNQDSFILMGGADLAGGVRSKSAWVFGLQGGYLSSAIHFKGGDQFRMTGGDVGAYGGFNLGGFSIGGDVNVNLLRLDPNLPGLSAYPSITTQTIPDTSLYSVGGLFKAGYTFSVGPSAFVQPIGQLAYVNISFNPLTVPGGFDQPTDVKSFRGAVGLRFGTWGQCQHGGGYGVSVEALAWDEFSARSGAIFSSAGGSPFFDHVDFTGVFGEVKAQATVWAKGGFSASLEGDWKGRSGYAEGIGRIGLRYQF